MTVPSVRHTVPNFRPISGLTGLGDDCTDYGICITDPSPAPVPIDLNQVPLPITLPITAQPDLGPGATLANTGGALIPSTPTFNSAGQPTNWAAILQSIAGAGAAGSAIYKSTQSPSLIPGTNLVYNPSGGPLVSASGLPTTLTPSTLGSMFPLLLIVGAVLLFSGGRK